MKLISSVVVFVILMWNASGQAQCIVINEIMINAAGPFDGQSSPNTSEWVELYNNCSTPVDIGCYAFSDGDFTVVFPSGTILQPYSFYTIGSLNSGFVPDLNWATCGCTTQTGGNQVGIFTNSNEQLILQDNSGNLVDAIVWGSGQFPVNNSTTTATGCPQQSFNYSAANNQFENIGASGADGCSKARACDGSGTWVELCGSATTPGASNNGETPLITFAASATEICAGACVNFSYTGNGSPTQYSWTFEGSSSSSSSSSAPQSICYSTAGDYDVTLSVTNACGTFETTVEDYIHVTQNADVTITANGSINLCNNQTVDLSVDDVYASYQWYSGANPINGATSATYTVSQSGTYSVYVTNQSCEGTSNTIQVNSTVVLAPPITEDFSECQGETITLQVSDIYDSYQWLNGGNLIAGATSSSYSFVLNETVEISVTVIDHLCEATSDEILITSIPLPQVSITPSNDVTVCQETYTLTGTSTAGNFQWLNSGVPIAGATSATYTATQDGDYSFISMSATGNCSAASNEVTIILGAELEAEILATALEACVGETITLSINGNYDNIAWSNNASSNSISVTTSGLYAVSVNINGCTAADEVSILFHPMPVVDAGNDAINDCDTGVILAGTGTGVLTWTPDPTLTVADGTAIALANPTYTTYYTLTATIGNCVATDVVMVEADCSSIYIPNVFTPNGDGVNDFFEVQVRGAKQYHLRIFNRWGEMLFESTDPKKVWNGGKQDYYAPDGVYFWTLDVLDLQGKPMLDAAHSHGHIIIMR